MNAIGAGGGRQEQNYKHNYKYFVLEQLNTNFDGCFLSMTITINLLAMRLKYKRIKMALLICVKAFCS